MRARQIILDFEKMREAATPEQINAHIFGCGQTLADILYNRWGQERFDTFTAQYVGHSRLVMIEATIEALAGELAMTGD
jgi:hypothetical protein